MSGHTPGPWEVDEYGDVWANGEDVAHAVRQYSPETNAANARLIAAAPDLLEALSRYVEHFGDPLRCARDAIAKATGSQP